jgi:hypothetical protein
MEVHHELSGGSAIEDLGAFKNPARANAIRVGELEGAPPEGPVNEVPRRVAGDVSFVRIEALRAVFAKPVPNMIVVKNSSAVGLDLVSLGIQPNGARLDELWLTLGGLGAQCGRNGRQGKKEKCANPSQRIHDNGMHSKENWEIKDPSCRETHVNPSHSFRDPCSDG